MTYAVDQGGGKSGANVYNDKAPTLCTTHGGEPAVAYTLKVRSGCDVDANGKSAGKGALVQTDKAATLSTVQDQYLFQPVTDTHILDDQGGSVINVRTDGKSPTLRAQMGGGTASGPSVVYGIDRAAYNQGQNAKYDFSVLEEQQPTMVAKGPGAICHSIGLNGEDKVSPTLIARMSSAVGTTQDALIVSDLAHYIVRRLTPTECARLQGFPDRWGDINPFNPDEWEFWAEVRNTHAAINGKKVQEYTAKQMETWYNKLHTDSAEYKMWGNGIAIPPALYVIQGMMDAFKRYEETKEDDSWML